MKTSKEQQLHHSQIVIAKRGRQRYQNSITYPLAFGSSMNSLFPICRIYTHHSLRLANTAKGGIRSSSLNHGDDHRLNRRLALHLAARRLDDHWSIKSCMKDWVYFMDIFIDIGSVDRLRREQHILIQQWGCLHITAYPPPLIVHRIHLPHGLLSLRSRRSWTKTSSSFIISPPPPMVEEEVVGGRSGRNGR